MKADIEKLKKSMINRRKSLLSAIRKSTAEETDHRKGDDIDLAESAYEQEMTYMMKSRGAEELKIINDAIMKIEKDEYGICEECEEAVGAERLKAMPFVKFCVECQAKMERKAQMEAAGMNWVES